MSNLLGQTIGKCRIEALIGSGGMGQVFRCRHIHLDRLQAIKIMHDHLARDPGFQARFRQEAHAIAALDHTNIIKLYDFDEQDGQYYLTMELLQDGSLRTLLDRRAREQQTWPVPFGLGLVRQAADALAFAHSKGIVHRDIKPDNMLILRQRSGDGPSLYTVKVSDFGLARLVESSSGLTSMGVTVGTPAYMSPEQCQGLALDGRTDIYSLGVVLYEIVTGYPPYNAQTLSDAVRKHVFTPIPSPRQVRPDIPGDVEEVILRCLAKEPNDRYASAADLSKALRDLMRASSPNPTPTPPPDPTSLHVQVLDDKGQVIQAADLTEAGLTAGRLGGNDLILNDPIVSRNHLRIEWNGRRVKVTDLATRIGTQLDGTPLQAHSGQQWSVGQKLKAGPFTLLLATGTAGRVAIMLPQAQESLTITPGQPVTVSLTVTNRGPSADSFALSVENWPAEWVVLPARPVELGPGGQTTIAFALQVPRSSGGGGSYRVSVRAGSLTNPKNFDVAQATWEVEPQSTLKLEIDPPRAQGRDQARYTVRLQNDGSSTTRAALSAEDERQQLAYNFSQNYVTIEPGKSAEVTLVVRSDRRIFGGAQTFAFQVTAAVLGSETQEVEAEFVQTSLLPI